MKAFTIAMILGLSTTTVFAMDGVFTGKIICTGEAEIQGMIFKKRVELRLELNSIDDGRGNLGHRAMIDNKSYLHAPDVSSCEDSKQVITCRGAGLGNGPELVVNIDKKSGVGSGYYFNAGARNVDAPNDSNTYRFNNLACR